MAIKIRKDGVVQDLVINANEVRVLDKDGNFRSKNLETVLKELNMNGGSGGGTGTGGSGYPKDAEYVYVKDSEPDMDGVWFDESDVSSQPIVGDNSVVKAIREYIDTDVKAIVDKNDKIVQDIKENVGDKLDVVSELAKPNLIVNGGFSVWQRGTIFSYKGNVTGQRNIYTADRWRLVQSADDLMCSVSQLKDANGVYFSISDFSKSKSTQVTLHQKLEPWSLQAGIYTLSYEYANTSTIEFNSRIFSFARNNNIISSKKYSSNGQSDWSKYSITFEITPDDIGKIIEIDFDLGGGQAYSNGTFYLRNVKLELGTVATPFIPRHYAEELALCQRYYQYNPSDSWYQFHRSHGGGLRCDIPCEPMRTIPTLVFPSETVDFFNNASQWESVPRSKCLVTQNFASQITLFIDTNTPGLVDFRTFIAKNIPSFDAEIY